MAAAEYTPSGHVIYRLVRENYDRLDFISQRGHADKRIEISMSVNHAGIRLDLTLDEARELAVELGKAVDFLEKD